MHRAGTLFVISAPSGAGKGTMLSALLERDPRLGRTVSVTTRSPREGEKDGEHYRFVDCGTFDRWVEEGEFLEWATVHEWRYGTLKTELDRQLATGRDVLLELDVQGMRSLKALREDVVSIFIAPPSFEELERRILKRGPVSIEELRTRLHTAETELRYKDQYDHIVINDDLETAIARTAEIIRGERERRAPG